MSSSSNAITGGCYCGNINYEVTDMTADKLDGVICHCNTCRRMHTMLSYNVAVPSEQLHVTKGEPKFYEDMGADSGKRIVRHFCGNCGSALYSYPDSNKDIVFIKAGSLDDLDRVVPKVEIFVERLIHGTTRESSDCKTTLFEGMMSKQIN